MTARIVGASAAALAGGLLVVQFWTQFGPHWAGAAAEKQARLARALAERAPLEADAYFLAALEAEVAADLAGAEALTDAAVRRNPRHGESRLWRLARYLSTGRTGA